MKFENKSIVAYNEDGVIVAKETGSGEIFTPSNITVKVFDTEEELSAYIIAEGLTEELHD